MIVTTNNFREVIKEIGYNHDEIDSVITNNFIQFPYDFDKLIGSTICEYSHPFVITDSSAYIVFPDDSYDPWAILFESLIDDIKCPVDTNSIPNYWINAATHLGIDPKHFFMYFIEEMIEGDYYYINDEGFIS